MCGICGIVNFKKDIPPSAEALKKMSQALIHRGPDDEGLYLGKYVGLAVRRLSIIDLITGHQPIHNEDSSIWLVFNGEIYNYKELRAELESQGHSFYTNSDTEVIVHTYEEYGQDNVTKLRGMFAFALWDEKEQTLFLARDRLGIKSLYYSVLNDKIIFASEIKSLFQSGMLKAEINPAGVEQFFAFSYVPGPQAIFQKIQKLLPAQTLALKDKEVKIREYWQLDYHKRAMFTENECQERLLELLTESVRMHSRSDVPLGVFLSGGIDSSAITYFMSQQYRGSIKTFSLGFDDEKFNELHHAKLIARQFKTEHHEEVITDRAIDALPEIVRRLSEPLADMSIIPSYFISKMAHIRVKVILSGEGGDEMFAGYPWYKVSRLVKYYQCLPLRIRQYLAGMIKGKEIKALEEKLYFYRRLRKFLLYSALPMSRRYLWRVAYFNDEQREKLFSEDFKSMLKREKLTTGDYPFGAERKFKDFLTAMLYFDTKLFLPDNLLVKLDQMTMAHSLEGRVPLLDHKLVEFAASLPLGMKLHKDTSKYILRKIIFPKVPKEIITKPKQGFMPPVQKWMDRRFDDFFLPLLNDKKTKERGYFNHLFIEQMIGLHKKGQVDYSYQLWALVVFELWLRAHLS